MSPLQRSFFPAWLVSRDPGDGIVISTRIRLARNFADLRFLTEATKGEKEKVLQRVTEFAAATNPPLAFQRLKDLEELKRGMLAERGLVHMESVQDPAFVALATGSGQTISLLVNEEDHLRQQVVLPGFSLDAGMKTAQVFDHRLGEQFHFATHREFGFLTACPTNVGTGLRASVMLHLPGLALTRGVAQVLQALLHMGLAVRGFYGEGTELRSVFFQVSNQMTLGRSEEEIITHLSGVVRQMVEREQEARQKLVNENRRVLEDKVGRALGQLRFARLLGFEEGLDLLSAIRLGVETGLLAGLTRITLNELLLLMQPAHLQVVAGKVLTVDEQLQRRADLVQRRLKLAALAGGRA